MQEPLYTEISRNLEENAGAELEHPDQAPAFTSTVRNPHCGHAVWGKKQDKTAQYRAPEPQRRLCEPALSKCI